MEPLTLEQLAAQLETAERIIAQVRQEVASRARESTAPSPLVPKPIAGPVAWGARVSPTFRDRVRWICHGDSKFPGLFPYAGAEDDLMTCMAWESGRSFKPDVRNMAGSGATGLIQFMPKTATTLGTSTAELAAMTAEDQLNFVYKYFRPFDGRIHSLSDMYMAILWPSAVGKPDDYALFTSGVAYRQNAGLDLNKDGRVTKAECSAKLYAMRSEGLRPENVA